MEFQRAVVVASLAGIAPSWYPWPALDTQTPHSPVSAGNLADPAIVQSRGVGWLVLLALASTLGSCPAAIWVFKFPGTTTVVCDRAVGTCSATQAYPLGDEVNVQKIDGMSSVQIRSSRSRRGGDSWPYHLYPNREPGGDERWIGNIMSMEAARRLQADVDAFLADRARPGARLEVDQVAAVFPAWLVLGLAVFGWLGVRFVRTRSTLRMKGTSLLITDESPWSTPVSREITPGTVLHVVMEKASMHGNVWLQLANDEKVRIGSAPIPTAEQWAEKLGAWLGVAVRRQDAPPPAPRRHRRA